MIVVECYADLAFLRGLGFKKEEIKHWKTGGKGKVFRELVEHEESVGLVDEDEEGDWKRYFKKVPEYLERVRAVEGEYNTTLLYHNKKLRAIVLRPRVEDWVLNVARNVSRTLEKLPNDSRLLRDLLRKSRSDKPGGALRSSREQWRS